MEFYAELSKKLVDQVDNKNYSFNFPSGVEYSRKKGSRCLFVECEDNEEIIDLVENLFDKSGIPFQRNE